MSKIYLFHTDGPTMKLLEPSCTKPGFFQTMHTHLCGDSPGERSFSPPDQVTEVCVGMGARVARRNKPLLLQIINEISYFQGILFIIFK